MSKQVDERVVSMQFDNANFEKNVQTSMSTIDKLKAKLKFEDAGKSFESLNKEAKKVNLSGINTAIQTVQAQFSALEVMGVTALANITNAAVNTGKRMISALTLDPVTTGFQEYETQINAVQTILANTSSKGTTIDDVNAALDELNKYADMTIYNFTEMTRNIGTFTAAGVDLDKSVTSIKGIANLAAVSGSTSYQASTAMYQLSQALAAGKVSLMDWNSVVNAGMGGELFQNALKRTAEHMGTNVDAMIEKYGSFRESLTKGQWLTAEVLTETLTQLSGAYTEADLIAQGYTEQQAKEIVQLANTAVDAATKVKTFTQLWDTMKEAAQSGWTQTWEIIIGDYEEAKELLTAISDFFTGENGLITRMSNARNNLLEGALNGNPFSKLAERIEKVTGVTDEMTKATQKYGEIVDRVIGGEFGNGQSRFQKLTEAGYDWAYVQNLVNERLNDSTRHATDFKESTDGLNKSQATTLEQLIAMSDEQLKNIGFTQDEIDAFNELEKQSEATGIPIKSLLEDMSQLNGRTLLINSFKNAGQGLIKVFSSMGAAWREVFPPMQSDQLYNIIAALHKFSTNLIMSDETADKLQRTLRGLFSLLDIITTFVGGGFKLAFKGISAILGAFDMDVLDATAALGDMLYNFRNFLFENTLITKGFDLLGEGVVAAAKWVKQLIDAFMNLPSVQAVVDRFSDSLSNFREIGSDLIDGFIEGVQNGTANVVEFIANFGKLILNTIKDILGIHSPSTKMFEIGQYVVEGFVNGVKAGLIFIKDAALGVWHTIEEVFGNIDWGAVLAVGLTVGMLSVFYKMASAIEALTSPFEGFGNVLDGVSNVLNRFAGTLKSLSFSIKAKAIQSLAISLAILVGSVVLMSQINQANLWSAIGALTALAAVMALFSAGIGKFGPKDTKAFVGFATAVVGISAALLLMTFAMRRLEKTDPDKFPLIIAGFTTIVLALVGVVAAYGMLVTGPNAANIEKAGSMFLKLSISMLIMTQVIRTMSGMSASDVAKGSLAITAFVGIFALLALITQKAPAISSLGGTLLKMSAAMLILVMVIKLISGLSASEILKGSAAILAFVGVFALLALITRLAAPGTMEKLGSTLLGMSASILILALVVKLLAGMSVGDIAKGLVALTAFTGIIALLTLITKLGGTELKGLAPTLLAMSVSIGILAGIAILLSLIDIGGLAKGIVAVGMLSSFMSLMILATRGANDVKSNLIVMSVAIAVLAAAVAGLSFIDTKKLAGATVALSTLMGMFALMEKMSSNATGSWKSMLSMTLVVAALAGIIAILANMNVDMALETSASISLLLVSMSASMQLISKSGSISTSALGAMAVLTAVVAALGGILYLLQGMSVESAIPTAISISTLLLAMSGAVTILGTIKSVSTSSMVAIGVLTAVVAGLAVILWQIQDLPAQSTLSNVVSLSTLLLAMSGVVAILSVVGSGASASYAGMLALGTLVVSLGVLLAAIGGLVDTFPQIETFIDVGIPILEKIGYALGSFFGNIAGGFMSGASNGLPEMGNNFSAFFTNLQPGLDVLKSVDSSIIGSIATIVGAMTLLTAGSFFDTIATFLNFGQSPMEQFKTNVTAFGEAMAGFSDVVAGQIDPESVTAAATSGEALAKMQTLLSASNVLDFFAGETNLEDFGTQIKKFGEAMVGFSNAVSQEGAINSEAIQAASNAAMIMVNLQDAIAPTGGWLQSIMGTQDLGEFGNQLTAFGEAIVGFSNVVSQKGAINSKAIQAAADAGSIMVNLQSSIEPMNGVVQAFTGSKDLALFGDQLLLFGYSIVNFSNVVSQEGAINPIAIQAAANAGSLMATLQSQVTPSWGVIQFFTGSQDLASFGAQLVLFGQAITSFSNSVSQNGGIDQTAVQAAANAGAVMAELQTALPESHWFDGKMDLTDFGNDLSAFGFGISRFASQVEGIDQGSVTVAISAAKSLLQLANSVVGLDASGIDEFKKVKDIGSTIKSYAGNVSELNYEGVNNSVSVIRQLVSLIKSMVGLDSSGVTSFQSAMSALANTGLDGFKAPFENSASTMQSLGVDLVTNIKAGISNTTSLLTTEASKLISDVKKKIEDEKTKFKTLGETLMKELANGVSETRSDLKTSFDNAVREAKSSVEMFYGQFKSAGSYLVDGFAAGIDENTWKAEARARAMARAAAEAAEEELDEHSPSRVFYGIGAYAGEGFVNALGDYAGKAYNTSADMANKARTGLSDAIGRISDVINGDVDMNPTIRPVLDLSDVENGSRSIGEMLGIGSSPAILATAGKIGYTFNRSRQNGPNDEVVSAIDRLRRQMNNVGGTSYTINGITYDDGSNVSEAVRSLVRAARIDRRI